MKLKQAKKLTQITINLSKDEIKAIDRISLKVGISRSSLVRNLVRSSLEDLGVLESVGVVDIVGLMRKRAKRKELEISGICQPAKA